MFNKIALLALVAPLVSGITLQVPTNPTSGNTVTITWTPDPTDVPFSLELVNTVFHNSFAIANNINPTLGQITLELPIVPVGSGYTLEAVNIGNISDIYSSTAAFSVGATTTGTTSPASTLTATGTTATLAATTSATTPLTTGTSSRTSSATSSTATTKPTSAAMAPLKINSNIGALAAVFVSAIAGAAIIAL